LTAYTYSQLEGFWIQAGGPKAVAPVAAAIALAESSGENVEQQGQPYATTGWGLWQITPGNSEPNAGVDQQLLNPQADAKAAVEKYQQAGNSFTPWTTFTSGKYLQFLKGNVPASNSGTTATPASTTALPGFSFPSEITSFFSDASAFTEKLMWLAMPSSWVRIGAFLAGVALLLFALHALIAVGEGAPIFKAPNIVPVPV
jgi:Lysozyme like domain